MAFVKDPCSSDDEAKRKAAVLGWDDNKYPTVYFGSDTTGEKAYEEFYVPGEKIDMQRFKRWASWNRPPVTRLMRSLGEFNLLFVPWNRVP